MSIHQLAAKVTKHFSETFYAEEYKLLMEKLDDLHERQRQDLLNHVPGKTCVSTQEPAIEESDLLWRQYVSSHNYLVNSLDSEMHLERQCVQLPLTQSGVEIEFFLRNGVRCFLLDLFIGSCEYNQEILMLLRTIEMKLSVEFGTAVRSSVVARIHPRLQYTGMLFSENSLCSLHVGRPIMLTCDRAYSNYTNASYVYVNANNILHKLKMFDYVYFSNIIKLVVVAVEEKQVECRVVRGGLLYSRMPVIFPQHIDVYGLSYEEMEDIVFCKEMSIRYMYSYANADVSLLRELKNVLNQLEYKQIKFGACISINGFRGEYIDYVWMTKTMDAFLIYLDPIRANVMPELCVVPLHMRLFLHRAYKRNQPIIFDAGEIASGHYIMHPINCYFLCYLPDRYLMHRSNMKNAIYFEQLQMMFFEPLPIRHLPPALHEAPPNNYINLARNINLASVNKGALLILIAFKNEALVHKIAFTRPKAQIVCVLPDKKQSVSVCLRWNITSLVYKTAEEEPFNAHIYEKLLYGLNYAYKAGLIKNNSYMVVVFKRDSKVKKDIKCEVHAVKFNDALYDKQLLKLMVDKKGNSALKCA